jgi:hypothetical protein
MFLLRMPIAVAIVVIIAGCGSQPIGPAIAVKPGPGKPFDAYLQDDTQCKQQAREQLAKPASVDSTGTLAAQEAQMNVQQRYFAFYLQCMRDRGNTISQ